MKIYDTDTRQLISVVSYNIQVGIQTSRPRQYLSGGWRHVMPHKSMIDNLNRVADLIATADLVGIQEADAGSLRTRGLNQVDYLSYKSRFEHHDHKINRHFAGVAKHSLGILSRYPMHVMRTLDLPGVPGRGVMMAEIGADPGLLFVNTHLSLGHKARIIQLQAIADEIRDHEHVIMVGDANCSAEWLVDSSPLSDVGMTTAAFTPRSYPSWHPRQDLDHVLVKGDLVIESLETPDYSISDHLPVIAHIRLPENLALD